MDIWRALLFGSVQGLTEFLPVSSSGHLILMERLSLAPPSVFLNLALHLATLLAVLVVMRREVWEIVRHPIRSDLKYVCLASLPTAGIALLMDAFCPTLIEGAMLPVGFLMTAALLVLAETLSKGHSRDISVRNGLLVGVAQGLAVLPGLSRSGTTISVLRLSGVDAERATGFSFLLSVPVIAGGFLIEGVKSGFSVEGVTAAELLAAAAVAFVTGLFAAKFMLRAGRRKMLPFAAYACAMGIVSFFLL